MKKVKALISILIITSLISLGSIKMVQATSIKTKLGAVLFNFNNVSR